MLPALPTGMQWTVGASPSTSTISNAALFCPSMRASVMELTTATPGRSPSWRTMASASSNVPSHGHDLRAVDECLGELAERDLPGRQDHRAEQTGPGRVGGGGGRRVPRRCADHRLRTVLGGEGDGHGHPAILERPGRVGAFELQPHPGDTGVRGQSGRLEQRGVALEQRDDRRRVGDGQPVPKRLDDTRPRSGHRTSPMTRSTDPTRCTGSTPRSASTVSARSASRARWVTKIEPGVRARARAAPSTGSTRRGRPNTPAIAARTPGRSATSTSR